MIGSTTLLTIVLAGFLAYTPMGARGQSSPQTASAVVVDSFGLVLVDPGTGGPLQRLSRSDAILGTVAGPPGVIYGSLTALDGSGTELFAIETGSWDLHILKQVSGRAVAKGVSADGERLRLLEFSPPDDDRPYGPPIGLTEVPVPDRWHGAVPTSASRDTGLGVLTPDGTRWLRLDPVFDGEDEPAGYVLRTVAFAADGSPSEAAMPLPGYTGYGSLLLSPDGGTAYVVGFADQTLQAIDLESLSVVQTVAFGQVRTKRPPCAAAISTRGDRLYLLGNTGAANAGEGIRVIDVATMRQIEHYLPAITNLYCLAAAPSGDRLYAVTFTPDQKGVPKLLTIDTATGRETQRVSLDIDDCCTMLVMATDSADAGT